VNDPGSINTRFLARCPKKWISESADVCRALESRLAVSQR
jgi:hypothetical protein